MDNEDKKPKDQEKPKDEEPVDLDPRIITEGLDPDKVREKTQKNKKDNKGNS